MYFYHIPNTLIALNTTLRLCRAHVLEHGRAGLPVVLAGREAKTVRRERARVEGACSAVPAGRRSLGGHHAVAGAPGGPNPQKLQGLS